MMLPTNKAGVNMSSESIIYYDAAEAFDVVNALRKELDEREKQLKEREKNIEEREKGLKEWRDATKVRQNAFFGSLESHDEKKEVEESLVPNEVLILNIGGTNISILRQTLCLYEKSMLASQFSGKWDENLDKDSEGNFFIDQSIELFQPLINFLRAKAIEMPGIDVESPEPPSHLKQAFFGMIQYYGMTNFVYPQKFIQCAGKPDSTITTFTTPGTQPSVDCNNKWATFMLEPHCHNLPREIGSYEVILLNSVERPQIGWARSSYNSFQGIGEDKCTIGLSSLRDGVIYQGRMKLKIDNLTLLAGTRVTCQRIPAKSSKEKADWYHWLVNDATVASFLCSDQNGYEPHIPAISGKGSWKIVQFTYI